MLKYLIAWLFRGAIKSFGSDLYTSSYILMTHSRVTLRRISC